MSKTAIELGAATTIPVIDFSGFTGCESATREATAGSIRRAFEDFGFLYLRNHGVAQSVIDELFSQGSAFFALPCPPTCQFLLTHADPFRACLSTGSFIS